MVRYNGARNNTTIPTWVDMLTHSSNTSVPQKNERPLPKHYEKHKKAPHQKDKGKRPKESRPSDKMYDRRAPYVMDHVYSRGVVAADFRPVDQMAMPPGGGGVNNPWLYAVKSGIYKKGKNKDKNRHKKDKRERAQKRRPEPPPPVTRHHMGSMIPPYFGFHPPAEYGGPYGIAVYDDSVNRPDGNSAGFFGEKRYLKKGLPRTNFYNGYHPEDNPTYATTITRSSIEDTPRQQRTLQGDDGTNVYDEHIEQRPTTEGQTLMHEESQESPYAEVPKPQQTPPPPPPPPPPTGPSVFMTTKLNPIYAPIHKLTRSALHPTDDAPSTSTTEAVMRDFDRQFVDFDSTPSNTITHKPKEIFGSGVDRSPTDWTHSRKIITEMLGQRVGRTTPPKSTPPQAQKVYRRISTPKHKSELTLERTTSKMSSIPEQAQLTNAVICERPALKRQLSEAEKTLNFVYEEDDVDVTIDDLSKLRPVDLQNVCTVVGGLPEEQDAYIHWHHEPEPIVHPEPADQMEAEPPIDTTPEAAPDKTLEYIHGLIDSSNQAPAIPEEVDLSPSGDKDKEDGDERKQSLPCNEGDDPYKKGCNHAEEFTIVPKKVQLLYDKENGEAVTMHISGPEEVSPQNGEASLWVDLRQATGCAIIIKPPPVLPPPCPRTNPYESSIPSPTIATPNQSVPVANGTVDLRQQSGRELAPPQSSQAPSVPLQPTFSPNAIPPTLYDGPDTLQDDPRQYISKPLPSFKKNPAPRPPTNTNGSMYQQSLPQMNTRAATHANNFPLNNVIVGGPSINYDIPSNYNKNNNNGEVQKVPDQHMAPPRSSNYYDYAVLPGMMQTSTVQELEPGVLNTAHRGIPLSRGSSIPNYPAPLAPPTTQYTPAAMPPTVSDFQEGVNPANLNTNSHPVEAVPVLDPAPVQHAIQNPHVPITVPAMKENVVPESTASQETPQTSGAAVNSSTTIPDSQTQDMPSTSIQSGIAPDVGVNTAATIPDSPGQEMPSTGIQNGIAPNVATNTAATIPDSSVQDTSSNDTHNGIAPDDKTTDEDSPVSEVKKIIQNPSTVKKVTKRTDVSKVSVPRTKNVIHNQSDPKNVAKRTDVSKVKVAEAKNVKNALSKKYSTPKQIPKRTDVSKVRV